MKKLGKLLPILGLLILILDTQTVTAAAAQGLELCIRSVIPSLFPFFVISSLISVSSNTGIIGAFLSNLFQIPPGSESILVTGFLGGYPVGARAVREAWKNRTISQNTAHRMLRFCSQPGPSFLFGILGPLFSSRRIILEIWAIIMFSAWLVSLSGISEKEHRTVILSETKITLPVAMKQSIRSMSEVCGWIIGFRVLLGLWNRWIPMPSGWTSVLFSGFLELTNGCLLLPQTKNLPLRILLATQMLTFGGLCVLFQTASVTEGLDIRHYLIGKLLQCLFVTLLVLAFVFRIWVCLLPIGLYLLRFVVNYRNYSRNSRFLDV